MKLERRKFGRALWINLLVLSAAMCGIYGLNGASARKIVLTIAVSVVFAGVGYVVAGRCENCGNSAAQR